MQSLPIAIPFIVLGVLTPNTTPVVDKNLRETLGNNCPELRRSIKLETPEASRRWI